MNLLTPIIIFEDENFLAVCKPAGMIVNKADTSKGVTTLQDWIEEKYSLSSIQYPVSLEYVIDGYDKAKEFKDRGGVVHRLDKETSGVILIAKNVEVFIKLQNQFKNGIVKKIYRALVHGKVENKTGEINAPIGRLPWNRMRFGVLPEGREAQTNYKVLEYKSTGEEVLSFIEAYPKTGRTHQIRVHFQHINHPIFSDELYAGRKQSRKDRKLLSHHFLHSYKISFQDPVTSAPMEITASIPQDLSDFYNSLLPLSS